MDMGHLISLLMDILDKNRLTKHIREITLHTLLRIIRVEHYNGYFMKESFLRTLIATATNKNVSVEVNKTAIEMLNILARFPDINQILIQDDEFLKLNIKPFAQSRAQGVILPAIKTFSTQGGNVNAAAGPDRGSNANQLLDFTLPEVSKPHKTNFRSNSFNKSTVPVKEPSNANHNNVSQRLDYSFDNATQKTPTLQTNNFTPHKPPKRSDRVYEEPNRLDLSADHAIPNKIGGKMRPGNNSIELVCGFNFFNLKMKMEKRETLRFGIKIEDHQSIQNWIQEDQLRTFKTLNQRK